MKFCMLLLTTLTSTLILIGRSNLSSNAGYNYLANAAIKRNASKLSEKYNMTVVGVGSGLHTNVNMLGISFEILQPMVQEEARKLFVACMEDFLKEINADIKLRPHLSNYPFESKNIRLAIFFRDHDGNSVYEPYVGTVSSFQDYHSGTV